MKALFILIFSFSTIAVNAQQFTLSIDAGYKTINRDSCTWIAIKMVVTPDRSIQEVFWSWPNLCTSEECFDRFVKGMRQRMAECICNKRLEVVIDYTNHKDCDTGEMQEMVTRIMTFEELKKILYND